MGLFLSDPLVPHEADELALVLLELLELGAVPGHVLEARALPAVPPMVVVDLHVGEVDAAVVLVDPDADHRCCTSPSGLDSAPTGTAGGTVPSRAMGCWAARTSASQASVSSFE